MLDLDSDQTITRIRSTYHVIHYAITRKIEGAN
jgi:hypothetical protein